MVSKEIIEITKKLIGFKTFNGNDKEMIRCFNFIKDYFKPEIKNKKIIVKEYRYNNLTSLVFSNTNTLKPDILLNGHIDVINADNKEFRPKIKNGRIYGRGSADMKSEVVIMMVIFKEAINSGIKKSISLMLTSDEEMAGNSGVGFLVNKIGYRSKVVIIPDGGHNFELVIKEKGGLWIKITAKGKSIHGSQPWLGKNAIIKLLKFYNALEKVFPALKETKVQYQDGVSLNLGKISGGKNINSVPDGAEMYLDIRYSEKDHKKIIIDTVKKLSKKHKVKFEMIKFIEILENNPRNYYIKKFRDIAAKSSKKVIKFSKATGTSDARFFSAKGIPVIIIVPHGDNEHGQNEWVEIKSLDKFYQILKEYIENI